MTDISDVSDVSIQTNLTDNSHSLGEELTKIRGIGAAKKQWLAALSIRTVRELAHASADEIESGFRSEGHPACRSEIEAWIAQAQRLVAERSLQRSVALSEKLPPAVETNAPAHTGLAVAAMAADNGRSEPESIWRSQASFTLAFQTRRLAGQIEQRAVLHHLETNTVETWSGSEPDQLQQWITARLSAQGPFPLSDAQLGVPPSIGLEVTQLRILPSRQRSVPMQVDKAHRLFPEPIVARELFGLEVSLGLAGVASTAIDPQQIVYQLQCQARHLATGVVLNLGETIVNVPFCDQASYKAMLSEMMLPEPGVYRLQVVVTLQNSSASPSCFKVPMLQVV